ncbi:interleukin-21 [Pezoporus wallicus]|uniref:interleukin-21 n=1 Tax=Pezoporus wallicus TaxID=35540 RepID=UPI00254AAF8D|nr:interleukin-21 [Pezoporus wallicus]XP_061321995.1 interleukin-21 [Pezoporus flaviventris]
MERMIILCILFLSSSMALTAAPYKTAKYKQLLKTIKLLETSVKDKDAELLHTPENPVDGCLFTAVTCFQKGTLKLQPENSQVNSTFIQTIKVLKRFSFSDPGKPCESSCESYEKKKPKEFLTSFAKLIKKVIRVESSWVLFDILQTIRGILFYIISDNALFLQLFKD